MKKSNKRNAVIIYSLIALFSLSLWSLVILYGSYKKNQEALDESKLKAESLLSEKLSIEKQINRFKDEISQLSGTNKNLDKLLAETTKKLDKKEGELIAAVSDKTKSLEAQAALIQKIKSDFEIEKAQLIENINQLKYDKNDLEAHITYLEEKNIKYEAEIRLLRQIADNFRIESLKGKKDKLTINARKTDKLLVGFDVPQQITEDINFKVITPEGKVLASNDKYNKSVSIRIIENDDNLVASISPMIGRVEATKHVEMTYRPEERLKSGTYKVQIFNRENYVGSCQVRLK